MFPAGGSAGAANVSEVSVCTQACSKGVEPWDQFHVMTSNLKPDVGQDAMTATLKLWPPSRQGFMLHGQYAKGKGMKVINSVDRGIAIRNW